MKTIDDKNNNITERTAIVAIVIILLLLFCRKKNILKNNSDTLITPEQSLLELTASQETESVNKYESKSITLQNQIDNLNSHINYLSNQLNNSNDNTALEAQIAGLQAQLNNVQNDLNYCESKKINLFQARNVYTSNPQKAISVDFGENYNTYMWLKDGVVYNGNLPYVWGTKGKYTVIATDGNTEVTKSIVVNDFNTTKLNVSFNGSTNASNLSSFDGSISALVSGGTPPYRYFVIDNYNNFKEGLSQLPSGQVKVIVVDSLGFTEGFRSGIGSQQNVNFVKIGYSRIQDSITISGQKRQNYIWFSNSFTNSTYKINGIASAGIINTIDGETYTLEVTETATGIIYTDSITIPNQTIVSINRTIGLASGGLANGSYIVTSLVGTESQNIIEISFFNLTTNRFYKSANALLSGNYDVIIVTDVGEYIKETIFI